MTSIVLNEVRKGFYLDSVALMRISRTLGRLEQVDEATLMMGTWANKEIMAAAGILSDSGSMAGGGDLVIAVSAETAEAANAAMAQAAELLEGPGRRTSSGEAWKPRTLRSAMSEFHEANLALISVPGAFAAAEARKAIRNGLHAMIFSDNVSIEDEVELKREARNLGVLVMGPDCGTSIISGTPLAFGNRVSQGPVGIVGASGTGIQEVACLIDRMGGGITHAIGVGGRDLHAEVGGLTTQTAIDALIRDHGTARIVVIAKHPGDGIARVVLDRLQVSRKPAVLCFLGAADLKLKGNVQQVFTLKDAAAAALDGSFERADAVALPARAGGILGLYAGGSLCAEAQAIFRDEGLSVVSNAPIAGVSNARGGSCEILDLGDDKFTVGRPHPMIDPGVRDDPLREALGRKDLGAILIDVIIGYGSHPDPAGWLAETAMSHRQENGPAVICSVTGTEGDPQVLSRQESALRNAGIVVAPSNADAARWALSVTREG